MIAARPRWLPPRSTCLLLVVITLPTGCGRRAGEAQEADPPPAAEAAELNLAAMELAHQGHYPQAIDREERALALYRRIHGPESAVVAQSLALLGGLHASNLDLEQADSEHKEALRIRQKLYGLDHPEVAASMSAWGSSLRNRGRYAEALPLLEKSAAIMEKQTGLGQSNASLAICDLAELYAATGEYDRAEKTYQKSIQLNQASIGQFMPDNPFLARPIRGLAALYRVEKRSALAETTYRRALEVLGKSMGTDSGEYGDVVVALAELHEEQRHFQKAEEYRRYLVMIRDRGLLSDRRRLAAALRELGAFLERQGVGSPGTELEFAL